MNKQKIIIVNISLLIINIIGIVLMFLPIYQDKAILPGFDSAGNMILTEVIYKKKPFARLQKINIHWLLYVVIALVGVAFIISIYKYISKKQFNKVEMITLITSSTLLMFLLIIASIQFAKY